MQKVKLIVLICSVVALVGLFCTGVVSVNLKFPQNIRIIYEQEDEFTSQNAQFKIIDASFLDEHTIREDEGLVKTIDEYSDFLDDGQLNLAIVKLQINNNSKKTINLDLTSFHLESGSFSSQFFYPISLYYSDCGMYLTLEPQEMKEITVGVPISSVHFLDYNSNEIKKRNFYVVSSLYPRKTMVKLNFNYKNW